MLVLSRRPGENIMIGRDIVVTVTKVIGDRVKIGIEAPIQTRILRGELYEPHFHATATDFALPEYNATKC